MIWNFFVQLIIAAVFFVVGELLRPPPDFEDAQATPFQDVNLPQTDPSRRQPVFWGRVDLRGPHVMDVTEYQAVAIRKKVKKNIFSSKKITIGYRYFMGMQLGVSVPGATLWKVWMDDREVWSGTAGVADDGIPFSVDLPDFYGGAEFGGGVVGDFRWFGGGPTQNASAYLSTFQTPNTPAYRWTSFLELQKVELGESPNIRNIAMQNSRYPDPLALGGSNIINGVDINPMSIMHEILTDPDWGFQLGTIDIDDSTFVAAAGTLFTEGNGMSLKWVNEQTIDRLIDQINKQVGGLLRYNPSSGKWEYKLLRDDYVIGNLKTFDGSNILDLANYSRSNWDETANQVIVNWRKLDQLDTPSPASAEDRSNFIRQGRIKAQSLTLPGCYDQDTATAIASRELFEVSVPLSKAEMTVTRDAFDLLPGDPFIFAWEELGITQIIMRVVDLGYGDDEFQRMQVGGVEDVFALRAAIFSAPPATLFTPLTGPPIDIPAVDQYAADQPFWMNLQHEFAILPGESHQPYTAAAPPQGSSLLYTVQARINGSGDPFVSENEAVYLPKGELDAAITEDAGGNDDTIASVVINNVSLSSEVSEDALTDSVIKKNWWNIALFIPASGEPEFVAYEDASVVGLQVTITNVHRGLFDTLPVAMAAGGAVYFLFGEFINGVGSTETNYTSSQAVDLQLINRTNQGEATPGTTLVVTMRNRVNRPYPAGYFNVNTDRYPSAALPIDSDVELRWRHRDRLSTIFPFHDDTSSFKNTTPGGNGGAGEEGFEYVLRIYDDILNALIRTVRASGGDDTFTTNDNTGVFYDYTLAKQQADGGAYARLRAELDTVDTATGTVLPITDVIRIFTVTIPVNFQARGPIYHGTVSEQLGFVYPMNEGAFPLEATVGGSGDATEVGVVGQGAPGPNGLSQFPVLMGHNNSAGHVGNLEMPDDPDFDQINASGFTHSFLIKCVRDGETLRRNILIHDTAAAAPVVGWYFGTFLDGGIDGKLTWYWQGFAGVQPSVGISSANRQLDDGKWHRVTLQKFTGGHTACAVFIDGYMAYVLSTSSAVGSTADFSVGGYSGLSSWTAQKMAFGMFGGDNNGSTMDSIMQSHIASQRWTPWVGAAPYFANLAWARGGGNMTAQGHMVTDWSSNPDPLNADDIDFSPALANSSGGARNMAIGNSGGIDAAWYPGPIVDGGNNRALDLGGNGVRVGNDTVTVQNVQGPKEYANFALLRPNSLPASMNIRFFTFEDINLGGQTDVGELYCAWIDDAGFIRISIETSSNNYRVHRTDNQCVFPSSSTWQHCWVLNRDTSGWEVWVNGVEFSVDNAFTTNGTVPAVDTFLNDRNEGGSLNSSFYHNLFNERASTDIPPGGTTSFDFAGRWGEAFEGTVLPTDDEIRLMYALTLGGFPTMLDVFLDYAPTHVFQVLDNTAVDLRGVLTSLTATGTYGSDEELPQPAHDDTMPARFQGAERMRYTDAAFKGTGQLDNWGFVVIAQIQDEAADMTLFANHRADDAATATNFSCYWDTGGQIRVRGSNEISNNGILTRGRGGIFCFGVTHTDAGGDVMKHFRDGEVAYAPAFALSAPGDTMGEFSIGARGTAVEDLDGSVHYLGLWDRTTPERVVRRIQLAFRGFDGPILEWHSHCDANALADDAGAGFIYPLADSDQSASQAENFIINDGTIQNMTLTGVQTSVRAGVIASGIPRYSQYASGAFLSGSYTGPTSYPYSFGAYVRVDSGTDAMVAISNSGSATQFVAVGIIGGNAAIRVAAGAAAVDETGSTSVTVGKFALVEVVLISDVSRKLYLNGELEAEFTTSRNVDGTVLTNADTVSVNRILGPGTDFDGSYQLFTGVGKELTDTHQRLFFRECQHRGWLNMTKGDGAIAQWLLDEPAEFMPATPLHRDQIDPAYTAQASSTGVTLDAAGLLPAAPGICCDFDGSNGGIDTNYTGYPVGTTNRVFECWLEAGFTGTVVSMGANVDAQALVVSVDGSGDLSVHIRGAGNERIWTTALDAGTEHHLWVELDGDSLHDFRIVINGVEETTIGTAGTDTTLATVATLDLFIGEDVTDIGTADGNGRIYGATVYDDTNGPFAVSRVAIHNSMGRARFSAVS